MSKIPFGFRPDVEEREPEAPDESTPTEISCTNVHESKAWSPNVQARVTTTDGDTCRLR